jgi:Uma2 family endonuclease
MVAQVKKTAASPVEPAQKPAEAPARFYSAEEYLALEEESTERHEYRDGEIVLMAGAMPNHNRITLNIGGFLNFSFRGQLYQTFVADQRLWIPKKRFHTYPDVMVIGGELQLQKGRKDTVTNPLLLIEVLSKSTADYDRGEKFAAYQTIPSFQEYLLVDQHSQHIAHYVKTSAKKWDFQVYDETDTVVQLATVGLEVPIGDIYDKVKFERSKSASE